ncbi:hypothetical protein HDE_03497 [Halotydeus destructor]|nr:hypothetical protein HDE_03497 [Halotydeus destructor]
MGNDSTRNPVLVKMKVFFMCLTVFGFVVVSKALKVKDRYDLAAIRSKNCAIAGPEIGEDYHVIFETLAADGGAGRCNITYLPGTISGYRLPDGNYTGLLGLAQKNAITFAFQCVRPAALEEIVVDIGPVVMPTELVIDSALSADRQLEADLMDVFDNVDLDTAIYLLILLICSIAILAWISVYKTRQKFTKCLKLSRFASQCCHLTWNSFALTVDQEHFKTKFAAIAVAWTVTCFATFVLVFGVILNLMSTDSFVSQRDPRIELVSNLVDDVYFRQHRVVILTVSAFYSYVRSAKEGTRAYRLHQRMLQTDKCGELEHCSLLEFDGRNPSTVQYIAHHFKTRSKIAALVEDYFSAKIARPTGCIFGVDEERTVFTSKDSLVSDYATMFFSRLADKESKEYFSTRANHYIEAGLVQPLTEALLQKVADIVPTDREFARFRCMRRMEDAVTSSLPTALGLKTFTKTLNISVTLACLSLALYVAEYVIHMRYT